MAGETHRRRTWSGRWAVRASNHPGPCWRRALLRACCGRAVQPTGREGAHGNRGATRAPQRVCLGRGTPAAINTRRIDVQRRRRAAAAAVTTTFGAIGNFAIKLIIGLYVAVDPETYRVGLANMLAPSARASGDAVLRKATNTLRSWLVAQLMAMAIVGTLTWLGLWIVGVPLAPILGLLAAFLAFIPDIGPIIAAAPAVLLASLDGPMTAALVVAVYVAVQTVESYAITPLIQQERVSLPPVLIISMQLLMGAPFGPSGSRSQLQWLRWD